MVKWIAQVEILRTTADGGGDWCGVVTGMGATPELALDGLRREGEALGQRLVQKDAEAIEAAEAKKWADEERAEENRRADEARRRADEGLPRKHPVPIEVWRKHQEGRLGKRRGEGSWIGRFEVVDVRLTPAPEEGGPSGWLAYGTLAREGEPRTDREDRKQGE